MTTCLYIKTHTNMSNLIRDKIKHITVIQWTKGTIKNRTSHHNIEIRAKNSNATMPQ